VQYCLRVWNPLTPDKIMQTFEAEILKLEASVLVDPQVSGEHLCNSEMDRYSYMPIPIFPGSMPSRPSMSSMFSTSFMFLISSMSYTLHVLHVVPHNVPHILMSCILHVLHVHVPHRLTCPPCPSCPSCPTLPACSS
jgi:hypothetical protein